MGIGPRQTKIIKYVASHHLTYLMIFAALGNKTNTPQGPKKRVAITQSAYYIQFLLDRINNRPVQYIYTGKDSRRRKNIWDLKETKTK